MATYVVLGNFTDQGIRNVKETPQRAEAFKNQARRLGITVKEVYWTLGPFDIVSVVDAPDEESVAVLGLSMGSLGNVRSQTLRAFSAEEIGRVVAKMP